MNVVLTIQVSSLMDHSYEESIYLNNNNDNPSSRVLPALTPPPQAVTNETESVAPSSLPPPPAPSPSPPPPLAHPQRPVFDTPYLPPGSTILVDSDEDDGSEFDFSNLPSDPDDPTVTTASSTTDSDSDSRTPKDDSPSEPSSPSSSSESFSKEGSVPSSSVSRTGTDASSDDEDDDN
ncbi:hypothetical protein BGZ47_004554 [Haplosporangium gracile]|nr:hypothetical protein BGZ47_004554 [Haplosporangium gracile]